MFEVKLLIGLMFKHFCNYIVHSFFLKIVHALKLHPDVFVWAYNIFSYKPVFVKGSVFLKTVAQTSARTNLHH